MPNSIFNIINNCICSGRSRWLAGGLSTHTAQSVRVTLSVVEGRFYQ